MLSAASRRRIYVAVSQRSGLALKALPTNGSTRDLLTLSKSEIIQTYRRLVEDAKSPFKDGVQSLQSIVSSRLPLKSSSTLSFLGTDLSSMKPIYPAKGALHPEIPFSNSVSQFQKVTAEHWELIYSKNTGYSLLMWGLGTAISIETCLFAALSMVSTPGSWVLMVPLNIVLLVYMASWTKIIKTYAQQVVHRLYVSRKHPTLVEAHVYHGTVPEIIRFDLNDLTLSAVHPSVGEGQALLVKQARLLRFYMSKENVTHPTLHALLPLPKDNQRPVRRKRKGSSLNQVGSLRQRKDEVESPTEEKDWSDEMNALASEEGKGGVLVLKQEPLDLPALLKLRAMMDKNITLLMINRVKAMYDGGTGYMGYQLNFPPKSWSDPLFKTRQPKGKDKDKDKDMDKDKNKDEKASESNVEDSKSQNDNDRDELKLSEEEQEELLNKMDTAFLEMRKKVIRMVYSVVLRRDLLADWRKEETAIQKTNNSEENSKESMVETSTTDKTETGSSKEEHKPEDKPRGKFEGYSWPKGEGWLKEYGIPALSAPGKAGVDAWLLGDALIDYYPLVGVKADHLEMVSGRAPLDPEVEKERELNCFTPSSVIKLQSAEKDKDD